MRFRFYDDLLLRILYQHPERGKQIFVQLFQHKGYHSVAFLNEKTNFSGGYDISLVTEETFLSTLFGKWKS